MNRVAPIATALLACATALGGCSAGADLTAADAAVTQFHATLNAGSTNAIYDSAAPAFRSASPREEVRKFMTAIHAKLGNSVTASRTGYNVNFNTAGNTVQLAYATHFQRGDATEQFIFASGSGKPLLIRYDIQSKALMLN